MAEHKNFQPTNPDGYQKYPNYFKPFRFFCQHVLPLVYDDSLSYYELLCKVIQKLNEVTNSVNMLIDDYKALEEAFEELIKYVDDYFNELVDEMNDLKEQWAEFKAEIEKEMADFKAQIEAAQEAFEEKITTQQNNFEAKITEEQENFENEITTQQNTFETKITNEQSTYETNLTNEWNTYKTNLNSEWTTYQTNLNTQFQNMLDKAQEAIDSLNDAVEALPDTVKTEVEEQLAEKLPEVKSELEEYCLAYLKSIPAVKYYPTNAEAIADVANLSEGDIIVVGRQSTSSYLANGGVYRIKTHDNRYDPVLNTTDTYDIEYNTAFALSDELIAVNIRYNYNYGTYESISYATKEYKENFNTLTLKKDNVDELYTRVLKNYSRGNRFPTPIELIMYDLNTINVESGVTNPFPEENTGIAYFTGVMGTILYQAYLEGLMIVYNDADNPTEVQLYYINLAFGNEDDEYYRRLDDCVGLTYVTPSTLDDKLANYTSTTDLKTELAEVKTEANTYTDNKLEDYYTNTEVDEKLSDITASTQNVFRVDTELTAETISNAMANKWEEYYNQLNSSSNFIIVFDNNTDILVPASDGYETFYADTFVFYGANANALSGIAYYRIGTNFNVYPFYCDGNSISSKWHGVQVAAYRIISSESTTTPLSVGKALTESLFSGNRIAHVYTDKVCNVTGISTGAGNEFDANTFIAWLSSNGVIRGIAMLSPVLKASYYTSMVYPFIVDTSDSTVYSAFNKEYYTKAEINDTISSLTISTQNVFVDDCTATTNEELGDAIYNAYTTYKEQTNGENFIIILNCTNNITVPAATLQSTGSFIANKFIITCNGAISTVDTVSGVAYLVESEFDETERVNAFYCSVASESAAIPFSCTSKGFFDIDTSESSAGLHNSIYRGRYLGTLVTDAQYSAISGGTFKDLWIGDYWTINSVNWRIAAFDYYYNCGDTNCTTHHVVLVPDSSLYNAQMNSSNITTGGYAGSEMYTANLETAKTTISGIFGDHLLSHRIYLTNAVTDGHASAGTWYDSEVDLMNENMVYGSAIFRPQNYLGATIPDSYTVEKSQLPLFALDPKRISNRTSWWLRDVVSDYFFADITNAGNAGYYYASTSLGVRPAFCIS